MAQDKLAIVLQAVTPLHVGSGRSEAAYVDLPVQRDEFGLPAIWASSLKGALKSHVLATKKEREAEALKIFGKKPGSEEESVSGASLLDARLLAIPARSLRGVWIYITSPHMLRYFLTYSDVLGVDEELRKSAMRLWEVSSNLGPGEVVVSSRRYLDEKGRLFLNEVQAKKVVEEQAVADFMNKLKARVPDIPKADLAVVSEDDVIPLVNRSMIVQYRIRLKETTKTVETGGLWSEEYLPQFTLLYTGVICKSVDGWDASTTCNKFRKLVFERERQAAFWVGGKETIGKGLVKMYLI